MMTGEDGEEDRRGEDVEKGEKDLGRRRIRRNSNFERTRARQFDSLPLET